MLFFFSSAWVVFAIIIGIVLGLLAGTGLLTLALMWRKRQVTHCVKKKSKEKAKAKVYSDAHVTQNAFGNGFADNNIVIFSYFSHVTI